jgi:endonuclease/exonuclease/phosphatase family metal-dependent hydrolase
MVRRSDGFPDRLWPVEIRAFTWNLFHGRDFPPDPELFTWRSRLLRRMERNPTHVQLNRDLLAEFTELIRQASWDVALLQECPPRWESSLAAACEATGQLSLTSRNWLGALRACLARRNPDLMGSWEGGSNLTLIRSPLRDRGVAERRELVLRRLPERRTMCFIRLDAGLCVANLHASTGERRAEQDVRRAAETAVEWADDSPLLVGGDFNLRPEQTRVFDELRERYGLATATAPEWIDHLLVRDLETADPPTAWPPEDRELRMEGALLRLSDHAPVTARFRTIPDDKSDRPTPASRMR